MKASEVITPVRRELQDEDADRWSDTELLSYLYDAEVEVIKHVPGAHSVRKILQLTPGETLHDVLEESAIQFLRLERNMGTAGTTPGLPITAVDRDDLNKLERSWGTMSGGTVIDHFASDMFEPRRFHTYPRVSPSTPVWVEALVTELPPLLIDTTREITLPTHYKRTLQLFIQGWGLMRNAPGSDFPRGAGLLGQAYFTIGVDIGGEEKEAPRGER